MPSAGLSSLDWVVTISYLFLSLGLGLWLAKKSSQGYLDFLLSGRKLTWWLAGTSVVATTFSVDTPFYVTELVRAQGIAGNWQWWCFGIGGTMGVLAVTYFAARWRRAEVVTEVEFVELRYAGKSAAFLRGFKAVYFALVKNSLGMAALFLAMATVLEVNVGIDPEAGVWIVTAIAFFYTLMGGLWGVVLTDFFQFVVAMVGSIAVAWYALAGVGGIEGLRERLAATGQEGLLAMTPSLTTQPGVGVLAPALFLVYLLFTWWANPNADGGGMFVQRMAACKNERHAIAGSLWAIFAHYVLRSWPWILAALVSVVVLPDVVGREAYPQLVNLYMPSGWKGLIVASFLAAFMSTVSTQLHWGASVLVNDLYKRFWAKDRADRHYVLATQAAIFLLVLLPIPLQAVGGGEIRNFVAIILGLGAGIGPALMARWFWWRANAWTEVSAILASTVATAVFQFLPVAREMAGAVFGSTSADFELAGQLMITTFFSSAVSLAATWLTDPVPPAQLALFYAKLKPRGAWGKLAKKPQEAGDLAAWLLGVGFLFCSLFAVGNFFLGSAALCALFFGGAGLLGTLFFRGLLLRKEGGEG